MGDNTNIEWCDASWSPITGCTPISEGCANCYAKRMATRLRGRNGYPQDDPFKVTFHPDRLDQPTKWRKPRRIFVCSMGDLFHGKVENAWVDNVFATMTSDIFGATHHIYLLLTKRPERILEGNIENFKLWTNIWVGVTCENQKAADERIPLLLQIPAAVRFVSIEPCLEYVNLDRYLWKTIHIDKYKIDWVIVGAETGPGARYMDSDWARGIRDQCKQAGIPFFMKKMSNKESVPEDLMVREYPS